MTARPFIRKQGKFWHIFVGRSDYALGAYFTSSDRAADYARRINITEANR